MLNINKSSIPSYFIPGNTLVQRSCRAHDKPRILRRAASDPLRTIEHPTPRRWRCRRCAARWQPAPLRSASAAIASRLPLPSTAKTSPRSKQLRLILTFSVAIKRRRLVSVLERPAGLGNWPTPALTVYIQLLHACQVFMTACGSSVACTHSHVILGLSVCTGINVRAPSDSNPFVAMYSSASVAHGNECHVLHA